MEEESASFKRPQFGNRFLPENLEDDGDETVFKHNAW